MKIERVNIGAIIEQIVKERGIKDAEFARMIGQKRQNVKKAVYHKSSIDSNLLCVISEALDCNLFNYFRSKETDYTRVSGKITLTLGNDTEEQELNFKFPQP